MDRKIFFVVSLSRENFIDNYEGVFNSIQFTIINQYIIVWIMIELMENQVRADKSVGESSRLLTPIVVVH